MYRSPGPIHWGPYYPYRGPIVQANGPILPMNIGPLRGPIVKVIVPIFSIVCIETGSFLAISFWACSGPKRAVFLVFVCFFWAWILFCFLVFNSFGQP